MKRNVRLLFTPAVHAAISRHLHRGDHGEHAGAMLCGFSRSGDRLDLMVREFIPATEGKDYVVTPEGHGRLQPLFIHEALCKAVEAGMVYVAIHNHFSDDSVGFSEVDLRSHERGYPTLLSLAKGLPVGAAVFGKRSVEVDIWTHEGVRLALETARIVGHGVRHVWSSPRLAPNETYDETFDRQLPFLRSDGQGILRRTKIGIVGLGGIGSQLVEPLVRLGIHNFVLIDPDRIERSNYSRVHGAMPQDLPEIGRTGTLKVGIAERLILSINRGANVTAIEGDVARGDVHRALLDCDFVFLAADTAEARLVCNAISHQFFTPMTQVGTKIVIAADGSLQRIFGVVRQIRPGSGCLWCNGLIDRSALADAAKPEARRKLEKYGVQSPNPAVVTFNIEVAGRALNDFVMGYASTLMPLDRGFDYSILDFISGTREDVLARRDKACPFCSAAASRFGRGLAVELPTI